MLWRYNRECLILGKHIHLCETFLGLACTLTLRQNIKSAKPQKVFEYVEISQEGKLALKLQKESYTTLFQGRGFTN